MTLTLKCLPSPGVAWWTNPRHCNSSSNAVMARNRMAGPKCWQACNRLFRLYGDGLDHAAPVAAQSVHLVARPALPRAVLRRYRADGVVGPRPELRLVDPRLRRGTLSVHFATDPAGRARAERDREGLRRRRPADRRAWPRAPARAH